MAGHRILRAAFALIEPIITLFDTTAIQMLRKANGNACVRTPATHAGNQIKEVDV